MNLIYTHWAYGVILIISLSGLLLADLRWKLVAFSHASGAKPATLATIVSLVGFFLIWDIAGIKLKIFFTNPRYTLGLNLFSPDLPIEEVLFLSLLVYSCLIIDTVSRRYVERRARTAQERIK